MTSATVNMNHQGRVSIPAAMRHELGLTPETPLVTYIEDGRVVLETREHLVRRIQHEAVRSLTERSRGGSDSVAEELIAERRDEAAQEQQDSEV